MLVNSYIRNEESSQRHNPRFHLQKTSTKRVTQFKLSRKKNINEGKSRNQSRKLKTKQKILRKINGTKNCLSSKPWLSTSWNSKNIVIIQVNRMIARDTEQKWWWSYSFKQGVEKELLLVVTTLAKSQQRESSLKRKKVGCIEHEEENAAYIKFLKQERVWFVQEYQDQRLLSNRDLGTSHGNHAFTFLLKNTYWVLLIVLGVRIRVVIKSFKAIALIELSSLWGTQ